MYLACVASVSSRGSSRKLGEEQAVCALRSLSIMGDIQNLIICVKMAWSERLDCGVNICNYAVDIYNFTASNIRASNLPASDFPASNFPIDLVIIV